MWVLGTKPGISARATCIFNYRDTSPPPPRFVNLSQAGITIRPDNPPFYCFRLASLTLVINLDPAPPDKELPQLQPSRSVWIEAAWEALQMGQHRHTLERLWSAVKMRPCSTNSIVQSLHLARKKSTWNMRVIIFNWMCLVAVTKINVCLMQTQVH